MRVVIALLVLANLALGAAILAARPHAAPRLDLARMEVEAARVRLVPAAPADVAPADVAPASASAGAEQPAPAVQPVAPARSATPVACLEWGGFPDDELDRARARLRETAPAARVAARELPAASVWWVHLPPLKSREDAERRVGELKALGIDDAAVIPTDGRWRNAVSLGVFRTEEAAGARLERMRELRVRGAAVIERGNLLRQSALVISEPDPGIVAQVTRLAQDFPGTEVKAAACAPGPVAAKGAGRG